MKTLRQREVGLKWIADEITETINRGNPVHKTVDGDGKKRLKATSIEPLTDSEEMNVALNALQTYLCDIHAFWERTASTALETISQPRRRSPERQFTVEVSDEEGAAIVLEVKHTLLPTRLSELLAEARADEENE